MSSSATRCAINLFLLPFSSSIVCCIRDQTCSNERSRAESTAGCCCMPGGARLPKESAHDGGGYTACNPKPDRLLEMSDMVGRRLQALCEQFCKVRPHRCCDAKHQKVD